MGQDQGRCEGLGKSIFGLQVARVLPHSPAYTSGLVPFFDIITAVDDIKLECAAGALEQFSSHIAKCENQQIFLKVYNLHVRSFRDVACIPNKSWGGKGLLGCSVEWSDSRSCAERSWHIVGIQPGSPADLCGELAPGRDYIIGMQNPEEPVITLIKDEDDFHIRIDLWRNFNRILLQRLERNLKLDTVCAKNKAVDAASFGRLLLLIYDSAANEVKEITLSVGLDIDVSLGLDLAMGLLHSVLYRDEVDGGCEGDTNNGNNSDSGKHNSGNCENKRKKTSIPVITFSHLQLGEVGGNFSTSLSQQDGNVKSQRPDANVMAQQSAVGTAVTFALQRPEAEVCEETAGPLRSPHMQRCVCPARPPAPGESQLNFVGRPATIPAISHGRHAAPAIVGLAAVCGAPHASDGDHPHVELRAMAEAETQILPRKQEEHKELSATINVNHNLAQHGGSDRSMVPVDVSLIPGKKVQPSQEFSILPPPLYFPIIRPATPTQ